jgi:hypothetical protein
MCCSGLFSSGVHVTSEEFNAREAALLQAVPAEFHSALSYYAYDKGHAYGHEEVLIHLGELVDMLAPCFKQYNNRVGVKL